MALQQDDCRNSKLTMRSHDHAPDSVSKWHKILPGIINEYQHKYISNIYEIGLFYHLILNSSLTYKSEKFRGRKKTFLNKIF